MAKDSQKHLAMGLLLVCCSLARGQYIDIWQGQEIVERPAWVPTLKYVKTDVEVERDSFSSTVGHTHLDSDRLYVSPALGIGWENYIYHPYLLTYSLLFEPGYVYLQSGVGGTRQETDELRLDGHFTANLLQIKPYATTLTFDRAHEEVKYDLFNSALVDSQAYGASTGYREGALPITLSFQQSHEDSTGFNQTAVSDETLLSLHARNERAAEDATDFNYQFGKFDRQTEFTGFDYKSENSYQNISLTDIELYRQGSLHSSLLFYDIESPGSSTENLNATMTYNLHLTPHLSTYETYALTWFDGTGFDSLQNYGMAGIQHQLYESLASGLQVHGSSLQSSSDDSTFGWNSAGVTGTLDYTKRLGGWGRLNVSSSASADLTGETITGSQLVIPNESHAVPINGLIRLSQPRVIAIGSVTQTNGLPLVAGSDYTVISSTDPWQIQIVTFGPSHIQPGSTVLISYTVQSNPSGSYSTLANNTQISLRLCNDRVNLFARYGIADNHASSPQFLLENFTEVEAGAEFSWDGLALRADYVDHRSTLYDFKGYNLSENYVHNIASTSTLGIDLNQQWTTFDPGSSETGGQRQNLAYYSFMGHYDWHPASRVNLSLEAGYRQQRGFGFDQDLLAVRAYFNWAMGKLEFRLGYEHDYRDWTSQTQTRDFGFFRVKRSF